MFITRSLDSVKADVKTIENRLEAFERGGLGTQIEKLQKAHDELAGKLSEMKGAITVISLVFAVISLVFAVLGGINGYNIFKYQEFKASVAETNEILVDSFQNKLADTIDRISLIDPSDEHRYNINELTRIRNSLKNTGVATPNFKPRSDLTDALALIINYKNDEAIGKLNDIFTDTIKDDFVVARALTLKAIVLARPMRVCNAEVKHLIEQAILKDSGVAAAFNIKGMCLTKEAIDLVNSQSPDDRKKSVQVMQDALKYYELTFDLKPTAWSKLRFLNNKVWGSAYFILLALRHDDGVLKDFLGTNKYENMDDFFDHSSKELVVCQQLGPKHSACLETLAELRGLQSIYYANTAADKAKVAQDDMKQQYIKAINLGLFKNQPSKENAAKYFHEDELLEKLHQDKEIIALIMKEVHSP